MRQLVFAVILTVVVVALSMANAHHVHLHYAVGEPSRIRLVFLVWIAFGLGLVTTSIYMMFSDVARRRRERGRPLPADPANREELAER